MDSEILNEKQNTEITNKTNQPAGAETVKAQYTEIRQTVEKSANGERMVKTVEAASAEATVTGNEVKTFAVREARIVTEAPAKSAQVEKNGEDAFVKRAGKQLENAREEAKGEFRSADESGKAGGQGGYGRGPVRRGNNNKKGRFNDNRGGNNQNSGGGQQIGGGNGNQPKTNDSRNPNRDGRDGRENREGRQENAQDNQSMRERFSKNERYGKNGRDNQEGGYRRRGSKSETVEDIRKDIEGIEKEIELEIADISVMRLGM